MAEHFTKAQAEWILQHSLPKQLRKTFRIQKVIKVDPHEIKALTNEELSKNSEKVMDTSYVDKWLEKLDTLNGLIEEMTARKEELVKQLSIIDQKKTDEEHYIEMVNCNAYQGYLAFSRLQNILKERRSIKNELTVLQTILKQEKALSGNVKETVTQKIAKMDNRKYSPRQTVELFDI